MSLHKPKSHYAMYILEPCVTEKENENFDIQGLLKNIEEYNRIEYNKDPITLVYVDIGEAEEWRWYWKKDWKPGNPEWIVTTDPDEWEGNYPVAFWYPEWEYIVIFGSGGMSRVDVALQAGFDGIYLYWVDGFSDEDVIKKAEIDGIPNIA
jgi:cysteinyl-tRNA synthetase